MKIEDYGKKLADLKNESQRKVADLKEDQNEIVTSKNENLKKKVSELTDTDCDKRNYMLPPSLFYLLN